MHSFFLLFNRYLLEKAKGEKLFVAFSSPLLSRAGRVADSLSVSVLVNSIWEDVHPPAADEVVPYAELPQATDGSILKKLAVLKLNGGLGTCPLCHRLEN
jgi:UTP--glucose-1-phosphate uridylyltransferase